MAKKENVELEKIDYGQETVILDMIHQDDELSGTFTGRANTISRIANADFSALIKVGNISVGFVMLVYNGRTKIYEIDMGILERYRGKGYGTQALSKLKKLIVAWELNVEIQTKQVNEVAIKSITKNGFVLCRQDDECNYYMLSKQDNISKR